MMKQGLVVFAIVALTSCGLVEARRVESRHMRALVAALEKAGDPASDVGEVQLERLTCGGVTPGESVGFSLNYETPGGYLSKKGSKKLTANNTGQVELPNHDFFLNDDNVIVDFKHDKGVTLKLKFPDGDSQRSTLKFTLDGDKPKPLELKLEYNKKWCKMTLIKTQGHEDHNQNTYSAIEHCINTAKTEAAFEGCAADVDMCIVANACETPTKVAQREYPPLNFDMPLGVESGKAYFLGQRSASEVAEDSVGLRTSLVGAINGIKTWETWKMDSEDDYKWGSTIEAGKQRAGFQEVVTYLLKNVKSLWQACSKPKIDDLSPILENKNKLEAEAALCLEARQCHLDGKKVTRAWVSKLKSNHAMMNSAAWVLARALELSGFGIGAAAFFSGDAFNSITQGMKDAGLHHSAAGGKSAIDQSLAVSGLLSKMVDNALPSEGKNRVMNMVKAVVRKCDSAIVELYDHNGSSGRFTEEVKKALKQVKETGFTEH